MNENANYLFYILFSRSFQMLKDAELKTIVPRYVCVIIFMASLDLKSRKIAPSS